MIVHPSVRPTLYPFTRLPVRLPTHPAHPSPAVRPSPQLAKVALPPMSPAPRWPLAYGGMPETQSLSSKHCPPSLSGAGQSPAPVPPAARTPSPRCLCVGVGHCWSRFPAGAIPGPHVPPHLVSFLVCCPVCLLPSCPLLAPALLPPGCLGAPAFSRPD